MPNMHRCRGWALAWLHLLVLVALEAACLAHGQHDDASIRPAVATATIMHDGAKPTKPMERPVKLERQYRQRQRHGSIRKSASWKAERDNRAKMSAPSSHDASVPADGIAELVLPTGVPAPDSKEENNWSVGTDQFVQLYQQAASRSIHAHTQSWLRIVASEKDVRTDDEANWDQQQAHLFEKFPYLKRFHDDKVASGEANSTSDGGNSTESRNSKGLDPLIWDEESFIGDYFDILTERCSRLSDALEDDMFSTKCWGTVQQLVHAPRCTLRLDSRYVCDGPRDEPNYQTYSTNATFAAHQQSPHSHTQARPQARAQTPTITSQSVRQYTSEQLIQEHFTKDTLNIVIVGAGPVGLQLANILNHLDTGAAIRILVFEKRVEHPGRKKVYSRNWITEVNYNAFRRGDPRIMNYFHEVVKHAEDKYGPAYQTHGTPVNATASTASNDTNAGDDAENLDENYDIADDDAYRKVNLPLMVIETLLLMSNRDLGVKFLYEDIRTHRHLLADVPNLVVFDASGHRLDKLERLGAHNATANVAPAPSVSSESSVNNNFTVHSITSNPTFPATNTEVTVSEWSKDLARNTSDPIYKWVFLWQTEYSTLKKLDVLPKIATQTTSQGTILYPVTDNGDPYKLRMLKLNDFRFARSWRGMYSSWNAYMRQFMRSDHPLCDEAMCGMVDGILCEDYCALSWGWDASRGYRPDIYQRMKEEWPFFSTMSAMVSLTPDQYDILDYFLQDAKDRTLPLRDLPVEFMSLKNAFRKNNLIYTLLFFASHSGITHPITSLYSYVPYIYSDVVVPPTAETEGRIGNAPLLRIGDTLSSGNANLGSGLSQHLGIIEEFGRNLESFHTTV